MSSKTNKLTLTYEYMTFNRNRLYSLWDKPLQYVNDKSVLTNKQTISSFKTSKIDIDIDHTNLKVDNHYLLSSGNHCSKFGNYQANGS